MQETHIDSRPKLPTDGRFDGGGQVPTVGTRTPGPRVQHQLFRTGTQFLLEGGDYLSTDFSHDV